MVALVVDKHLGLVARRRKAVEWMIRSQSRLKSLRVRLTAAPDNRRPRLCAGSAGINGAWAGQNFARFQRLFFYS